MTTLDVQTGKLYAAVEAFAVVKRLDVSTQFPHGMRIRVIEQRPVAVVVADGVSVPVAADGTLMHDLARLPALPRIELAVPPGGPRLTEPAAVNALAAANAAPHGLLLRISLISTTAQHGLVAQLRGGPVVYLGNPYSLAAKWRAVLAVLAHSGSGGASYIDVTDPTRPAAGVNGSGTSGGATGSTTGTASTPGSATGTASTTGSASTTSGPTTSTGVPNAGNASTGDAAAGGASPATGASSNTVATTSTTSPGATPSGGG
jgi:hypothetical protein